MAKIRPFAGILQTLEIPGKTSRFSDKEVVPGSSPGRPTRRSLSGCRDYAAPAPEPTAECLMWASRLFRFILTAWPTFAACAMPKRKMSCIL
jgi:hypothetical protein